jgi:hypothetical protein
MNSLNAAIADEANFTGSGLSRAQRAHGLIRNCRHPTGSQDQRTKVKHEK